MSKTIDVREGDEFGADVYLCQTRGDRFRNLYENSVSGWCKGGSVAQNPQLRPVSKDDAMLMLTMAGYSITRDDGKVEGGDEAKPADVPEVDAVWVEDTMVDGSKSLTAYSGRESAESCADLDIERGRARIVRIRPDTETIKAVVREMLENYSATDHNARAIADDAKVRAADAIQLANDARDRGRKANERLDALESRLASVEKPKATGVVKVPKFVYDTFEPHNEFDRGLRHANAMWKEALTAAGVKWEESNGN